MFNLVTTILNQLNRCYLQLVPNIRTDKFSEYTFHIPILHTYTHTYTHTHTHSLVGQSPLPMSDQASNYVGVKSRI